MSHCDIHRQPPQQSVALVLLAGVAAAAPCHAEEPARRPLTIAATKVLSTHGSTRATRYSGTNKIVTLQGKTHVAWLDSISETMVATFDHATGAWGEPVRVGTGKDNHGGPALAADSGGHLHVVFGPHHGPFQHCRSARPNDASAWMKLPEHDAFFKRVDDALKVDGIACDPAGRPWITVTEPEIHHHDGKQWQVIDIASRVDPPLRPVDGPTGANAPTSDTAGTLYLPAYRGPRVVLLSSTDRGKTFRLLETFPPDEKLPHVGLSIERPTGHNEVGVPWLLFSTGEKGPDCFGEGIFHTVRAVQFRRQP